MTAHETHGLAQRFIDALHQLEHGGGVNALVGLFSYDAQLVNPQIEHRGQTADGVDAVRQFWENYRMSFREIRSRFETVTSGEGSAGLFWRSQGTDAQGKPIDYDGATLLLFDESGKIRHFHGYFDSRSLQHSVSGSS